MSIETILTSVLLSAAVAIGTTLLTLRFNRQKLRREFQLEFATEAAIRALLMSEEYEMRSFEKIKRHLPGFKNDDDLRLHLIRAGAVCFTNQESGEELWGLLEKHKGKAFK